MLRGLDGEFRMTAFETACELLVGMRRGMDFESVCCDKKEALAIILKCAQEYKSNLVDRNLLFICVNSALNVCSFEVIFTGGNFLHLTGVKFLSVPAIKPNAFYSRCVDKRLSVADFGMDKQGYTTQKLLILPQLVKKNLSANIVGDYNGSRPLLATDRLAATYRKRVSDGHYEEPVYKTRNIVWSQLKYPVDWADRPRPDM